MGIEYIDTNTDDDVHKLCEVLATQFHHNVLAPALRMTPPPRRQKLVEGIIAGITGGLATMIGEQATKEALGVAFECIIMKQREDAGKLAEAESQGRQPNSAERVAHQNATAGQHPLSAEEESRLRESES